MFVAYNKPDASLGLQDISNNKRHVVFALMEFSLSRNANIKCIIWMSI